jgi:23S rRNA (adenine2503-C2)-methyltransferase
MTIGNSIPAETFRWGSAGLRILARQGNPDVAVVYVGELEGRPDSGLEFVDGLDPAVPRRDKWIINVSTQLGCPVGCLFCDAGGDFRGHLDVDEMMAQVRFVASLHPGLEEICGKLKVHFSRMGEPALNDAVPDAILRLRREFPNPNAWCCLATTAPAGRDAWFRRLGQAKAAGWSGRFQLQFSVNSTDEAERLRLMPVRLWGLEDMARYGELWFTPGDRRIVLNFALADGLRFDVDRIRRFFDPAVFAVKLTPLNPTRRGREAGFVTVLRNEGGRAATDRACERLSRCGYDVVISVGDGREDLIGSNCGQAVGLYRGEAADSAPAPSRP